MKIEKVVTSGVFSLDGQDFDVDNNVWVVGDDAAVLVVDAAHDPAPIAAAVGLRAATIVCTHGHNDHVNAAVSLADLLHAPVLLHPADRMLWDAVHPDRPPDGELADCQLLVAGDQQLAVVHTPGHSPGGVCLVGEGVVFSGDTLFAGGPGSTGRSYSDFPTILASIRDRLFALPAQTVVHPGHGVDTTIGAELPGYEDWVARGH